jgi:hypothetical protein
MIIRPENGKWIIEFEKGEDIYYIGKCNNIFDVKNYLLRTIEEKFEKEVTELLHKNKENEAKIENYKKDITTEELSNYLKNNIPNQYYKKYLQLIDERREAMQLLARILLLTKPLDTEEWEQDAIASIVKLINKFSEKYPLFNDLVDVIKVLDESKQPRL